MTLKVQQNHLLEIYIFPVNDLNRLSIFFATGFYSGYISKGPGTVGALVGILIFLLVNQLPLYLHFILLIIYLFFSFKTTEIAIKFFKKTDPPQVNCDEILGMWIALIFFDVNLKTLITGFILFRIFDIWKPFPIKYFEKMGGAIGVLSDDIIAGLIAKGGIWLIWRYL